MTTSKVSPDPRVAREVERDRDRLSAFVAGWDDTVAGVRTHHLFFAVAGVEDSYLDGAEYARESIRLGEVTVEEVVAAAKAVHEPGRHRRPSWFARVKTRVSA